VPDAKPSPFSRARRTGNGSWQAPTASRPSLSLHPYSRLKTYDCYLSLHQYRIQARLKVLLAFAREFAPFDRQGGFHRLHPRKQFLDVLPGFLVILLQIVPGCHPIPEGALDRMVGAFKRVRRLAGREQSCMSREEMLETQIRNQVAGGRSDAPIVGRPLA